jgi:hypothetical protein
MAAMVAVPADQAWFWDEQWQHMERDAGADARSRHTVSTEGPAEFLAELDS